MSICSVIACTEMDDKHSCGKRFGGEVNQLYSIDKLNLNGIFEMDPESGIFPCTLTTDLYPLVGGTFDYKK